MQGLGLVFVAVYQKTLSLLYVDELLQRVKQEFTVQYKPDVYDYTNFSDSFKHIVKDCESKADAARKPLQPRAMNHAQQGGKGGKSQPHKAGNAGAAGQTDGKSANADDDSDSGVKGGSSQDEGGFSDDADRTDGDAIVQDKEVRQHCNSCMQGRLQWELTVGVVSCSAHAKLRLLA